MATCCAIAMKYSSQLARRRSIVRGCYTTVGGAPEPRAKQRRRGSLDVWGGPWLRCRVSPPPRLLLVAFVLGAVGVAAATTGKGEAVKQALDAVEGNPKHAKLAAEPIKEARAALGRAEEVHVAGDAEQAERLVDLAGEWAGMSQDLVRAAQAETTVAEVLEQVKETEGKTLRARALLEQTVARRGRATARLTELESGGPAASAEEKP